MASPVTRCDVAPWSLMGISMAGYNAIISGIVMLISICVVFRKPYRSV